MDHVISAIKKNPFLPARRKANAVLRCKRGAISCVLHRMGRSLLTTSLALLLFTCTLNAATRHPLDPLTAGELATIRTTLLESGRFSTRTKFEWIELEEPPKQIVKDFKGGSDFSRNASVVVIDFDRQKSFRAIVDLNKRTVASLTEIKDSQPGIAPSDADIVRTVIDGDPQIKAALIKRGLHIPDKVYDSVRVLYFPIGHDPELDQTSGRLVRVLFASDQAAVNNFSPLIDGMMAIVDLNSKRVIRLEDKPGVSSVSVPHDVFNMRPIRSAPRPKPTARTRTNGNISVDGNTVTWQKWAFRYGFNVREGLVLYQVNYGDEGKRRSILYRASISEIATAYGNPGRFFSWMEYFEGGEFGLGYLSTNVRAGREIPANAMTLSPVMPDSSKRGFSTRLEDRIFLYERDAGNLLYYRQQELAFHARPTELVIGFVSSVGNYVYGFNWVFRQDGSFAFEAELAGEILTKFVAKDQCEACPSSLEGPGPDGEKRTYRSANADRYGRRVHPSLVGIHHQHWFNVRLDFDLDGEDNAVMENNVELNENHGATDQSRALTVAHTVFGKAVDAKRHMHEGTARTWTIYKPAAPNQSGGPAGYTLLPMENTSTLFPQARANDRSGFTFNHFWTTPYREGELYAAGRYPNQAKSSSTDSLVHYANNDSIYNRDIVVWYSLGQTHVVRPEDYPLISNMRMSVVFRPDGFFPRNPALELGRVSTK